MTHHIQGTAQSAAMRTLYENLADMGGLKISKKAFNLYLKNNRYDSPYDYTGHDYTV